MLAPVIEGLIQRDVVDRLSRQRHRTQQQDVALAQARMLVVDPDALSADAALTAMAELQVQRARLDALESRLLVRAAGATRVVRDVLVEDTDAHGRPIEGRDPRILQMVDEVVEEIAAVLRRTHGSVQWQLEQARLLNGPLVQTRNELAAGRITAAHAASIADQARRLVSAPVGSAADADEVLAEKCARLQERVLPWAVQETAGQTRARARRAVASVDPAGAARRREHARRDADVTGRGLDDGLALIEAVLPALDAARVLGQVDAVARRSVGDGSVEELGLGADATLGQVRAAVFARLLSGRGDDGAGQGGASVAAASCVRVEVGVLIDAATLLGLSPDEPAWVQVGSGEATDVAREDVLALLDDPATPVSFRRLVTDPATGALVDRGARAYAVTDELRAWLVARDQVCAHPGCTRPAVRCDIDHAVDHADGGLTTVANTRPLCRRHHNAKTHGRWRIEDSRADGSCTFVSPAGRRYAHRPVALAGIRTPRPPACRAMTDSPDPPPF